MLVQGATYRAATDTYPWTVEDLERWYALDAEDRRRAVDVRLASAWADAWHNIPFYRRLWETAGLKVDDVATTADLERLPPSNIDQFRRAMDEHPPYGDVISQSHLPRISDILTSGGTTGAPRPVPVTPQAKEWSAQIAARSLAFVGVTASDVIQVTSTFSTHGAAWIASWAAETLQAMLVPTSSGAVTRSRDQVEMLQWARTTTLRCSPSYAQILAATAREGGLDPAELGVRRIITAGEVVSPALRRTIEQTWNAEVFDLYGTMETLVWSSIDCRHSSQSGGELGMHIWDDAIIVEVLRPDGSPCDDGEYGELAVTSWVCEVGPKFRYRMGDRVAVVSDPCPCGTPTPRLLPLAGRLDDCLRVRGANIWPSTLEDAVRRSLPDCEDYVLVADRREDRDRLRLLVAMRDERGIDEPTLASVTTKIKASLSVTLKIETVTAAQVAEMSGAGSNRKTRRIIDMRRT